MAVGREPAAAFAALPPSMAVAFRRGVVFDIRTVSSTGGR
jgi:hypothetical protein